MTTLYNHPQIDVNEACTKLCEQGRAYLDMPAEQLYGLTVMNSEVMDYFQPHQQADIFRIKGMIYEAMHDADNAAVCFATSAALCRGLADTWLSWAQFCDSPIKKYWSHHIAQGAIQFFLSMAHYANAHHNPAHPNPNPPPAPQQQPPAPPPAGFHEQIERATACYLEAIKLNSPAGRTIVPRLLNLLAFENGQGAVVKAFGRYQWTDLPAAPFLPWVPSLLAALPMEGGAALKPLIKHVAAQYPQAIYWQLRLFSFQNQVFHKKWERDTGVGAGAGAQGSAEKPPREGTTGPAESSADRDRTPPASIEPLSRGATAPPTLPPAADQPAAAAAAAGSPAAAPAAAAKPAEVQLFEWSKELMDYLQRQHPSLRASLDNTLYTLHSYFNIRPEERMLTLLHTVLMRAYRINIGLKAPVPEPIASLLKSLCEGLVTGAESATPRPSWLMSIKDSFDRDFDPTDARKQFPATIGEVIEKLKWWRAFIAKMVDDRFPTVLRLEDECPLLHEMALGDIEMPGTYAGAAADMVAPLPELVVRIEHIENDVEIVRRNGNSFRRLAFVGTDGRTRHFLLQANNQTVISQTSELRMYNLMTHCNRLMAVHSETRRRNLQYYVPACEPIYMGCNVRWRGCLIIFFMPYHFASVLIASVVRTTLENNNLPK